VSKRSCLENHIHESIAIVDFSYFGAVEALRSGANGDSKLVYQSADEQEYIQGPCESGCLVRRRTQQC
jgi:hypothetical protein